jgi:hypothetical protein
MTRSCSHVGWRPAQWSTGWLLALLMSVPMTARSQAVTLTVGVYGTNPTIQSAIDDCPLSGTCTIKVQGWTAYSENLSFPASFNATNIDLSGGWDPSFTQFDPDAETIIDGGGTSNVVGVAIQGGQLSMARFTVTNGGYYRSGAGLRLEPNGASTTIILTHMTIQDNHSSCSGSCSGGGVWAFLDEYQSLLIDSCVINNNTAFTSSSTQSSEGAGLTISAGGHSAFFVENTQVNHNATGGLYVAVVENATGEIYDLQVIGNTTAPNPQDPSASGGAVYMAGDGALVLRRSVWALNDDDASSQAFQLHLHCLQESSLFVTDSFVGLGSQGGLKGYAQDTAQVHATNLTVVRHTLTGVDLYRNGSPTVTLYNTISYANGTDLSVNAGVDAGSNLVGVNPQFVNPVHANFHLQPGSPAIDAGSNSPPGGLGPTDLDGNPRVINGTVDIGCYEAGFVFHDGFESGNTTAWSSAVPQLHSESTSLAAGRHDQLSARLRG